MMLKLIVAVLMLASAAHAADPVCWQENVHGTVINHCQPLQADPPGQRATPPAPQGRPLASLPPPPPLPPPPRYGPPAPAYGPPIAYGYSRPTMVFRFGPFTVVVHP